MKRLYNSLKTKQKHVNSNDNFQSHVKYPSSGRCRSVTKTQKHMWYTKKPFPSSLINLRDFLLFFKEQIQRALCFWKTALRYIRNKDKQKRTMWEIHNKSTSGSECKLFWTHSGWRKVMVRLITRSGYVKTVSTYTRWPWRVFPAPARGCSATL